MAYVTFRYGGSVAMTVPSEMPGFTYVDDADPRVTAFAAGAAASEAFASRIAFGLAITSPSTPGINATYALDDVSTGQIYQIGLYCAQFGVFPSGAMTQAYPDANGTLHTFTPQQFVALLRVVAPLVSALSTQAAVMTQGGAPSWPEHTAVIA